MVVASKNCTSYIPKRVRKIISLEIKLINTPVQCSFHLLNITCVYVLLTKVYKFMFLFYSDFSVFVRIVFVIFYFNLLCRSIPWIIMCYIYMKKMIQVYMSFKLCFIPLLTGTPINFTNTPIPIQKHAHISFIFLFQA